MNELIEEYLRSRGVRYFRGHRDDEYFYIVEASTHGPAHTRLYVHLDVCGADRAAVQISIAPDRYYPAGHSDRIGQALSRWNGECHRVGAMPQESSDPSLVGVAAGSRYHASDPGEFSTFVEGAEAAAAELFASLGELIPPVSTNLRDAG